MPNGKPSASRRMETWKHRIATTKAQLSVTKSKIKDEKSALEKSTREVAAAEEARHFIQTVAQTIQAQTHERIAGVVSNCLSCVFGETYDFRISVEKKRGKTEARVLLVKDGKEIDPVSSTGGGVLDVAAFALRLAALLLSRPSPQRLLVLDEPFRFLSRNYQQNIGELLQSLADEFGIQFVLVTHSSELEIGKVVRISSTDTNLE